MGMSFSGFAWRMLRRDARAGELRLLVAALVVAIAALTAVGFFTDRIRQALEAPLSAGLAYENEMNVLCFAAGDHREGIRAFAEKRDAAFRR